MAAANYALVYFCQYISAVLKRNEMRKNFPTIGVTATSSILRLNLSMIVTAGCVIFSSWSACAQEVKGNTPSTLPGGASSLTETFEDWTVFCVAAGGKTQCIVSQSQIQQNGQRVLDIRLNTVTQPDGSNGSVTLPFGLELEQGVTVQLDDGKIGKPLSFRTCLPNGCLVPLSIDRSMLQAMSVGTSLKLVSVSTQNETTPFIVSLKGFGPALDRAESLMVAK
ncbi:invasion associated locus B family protein [Ochrobactrum sp. SFR4]|uniref:invasion associated locus B family protein n=1 Tax=Ochrobactrum sp. SFR4 TaxID=2717368 RepID=UPI001C8CCDC9|nr:invasion associated locus B family protein [Ochrobactrum sp. SFR4]MBX8827376.1 invasion associated locus B family protein [Ochrobactrum sp. SFR4]